jgi:hypothetical protein
MMNSRTAIKAILCLCGAAVVLSQGCLRADPATMKAEEEQALRSVQSQLDDATIAKLMAEGSNWLAATRGDRNMKDCHTFGYTNLPTVMKLGNPWLGVDQPDGCYMQVAVPFRFPRLSVVYLDVFLWLDHAQGQPLTLGNTNIIMLETSHRK